MRLSKFVSITLIGALGLGSVAFADDKSLTIEERYTIVLERIDKVEGKILLLQEKMDVSSDKNLQKIEKRILKLEKKKEKLQLRAENVKPVQLCHLDKKSGEYFLTTVKNKRVQTLMDRKGDYYPTPYFEDNDGDGFGDSSLSVLSCNQLDGYVTNGDDLDDSNPDVTDVEPKYYYFDYDGDGFGDATQSHYGSEQLDGFVENDLDLDDTNPNITDMEPLTYYADADGDGFGDPNVSVLSSIELAGYVLNSDDLDDTDPSVGDTQGSAINYAAEELFINSQVYDAVAYQTYYGPDGPGMQFGPNFRFGQPASPVADGVCNGSYSVKDVTVECSNDGETRTIYYNMPLAGEEGWITLQRNMPLEAFGGNIFPGYTTIDFTSQNFEVVDQAPVSPPSSSEPSLGGGFGGSPGGF